MDGKISYHDILNGIPETNGKVIVCAIAPKVIKPRVGQAVYSRSYNSLMNDAREASAIIRIGASVLLSVERMDKYYDSLAGGD